MPATKRPKLSKPVMVRMEHTMKEEIERVAADNDLTSSDIIRLAMKKSLPAVKASLKSLRSA